MQLKHALFEPILTYIDAKPFAFSRCSDYHLGINPKYLLPLSQAIPQSISFPVFLPRLLSIPSQILKEMSCQ